MSAHKKSLYISFAGFVIAFIGVITGFVGDFLMQKEILIAGFSITAVGVAIGFFGIAYGWVSDGATAIKGSIKASKELKQNLEKHFSQRHATDDNFSEEKKKD